MAPPCLTWGSTLPESAGQTVSGDAVAKQAEVHVDG